MIFDTGTRSGPFLRIAAAGSDVTRCHVCSLWLASYRLVAQKDAERNSTSGHVTQRVPPPDLVKTKGGCHSIMFDMPRLIWRVWQPTDGNLAEPVCRAEGRRGTAWRGPSLREGGWPRSTCPGMLNRRF